MTSLLRARSVRQIYPETERGHLRFDANREDFAAYTTDAEGCVQIQTEANVWRVRIVGTWYTSPGRIAVFAEIPSNTDEAITHRIADELEALSRVLLEAVKWRRVGIPLDIAPGFSITRIPKDKNSLFLRCGWEVSPGGVVYSTPEQAIQAMWTLYHAHKEASRAAKADKEQKR